MRKNQALINISDDIDTKFGTIISINRGTKRAVVQLENGPTLENLEFFYHCSPDNIDEGSSAFTEEDKVLIANDKYIIGFKDLKPRECISPRFFVKINKGSGFEYYWLILLNDDGNYEPSIKESIGGRTMEIMAEPPYNNEHIATKAFVLKDEDENEERWVAAPHLLTKNRVQQFLPLYHPATEILSPPQPTPMYPLPASCFLYGPGSPGLNHPCPPNRFYCNVDDNIMAWYSVYSVDNPVPPAGQEELIFGIIYKIEDEGIQVTTFSYSSRDLEDLGFQGYWFYQGVVGDIVSLIPEVPINMVADIELLTKDQRRIVIPWRSQPIRITHNFDGSGTTYEEANSADHWFWDTCPEGFKQELFAEMTQEFKSGEEEYQEENFSGGATSCSEHHGNKVACLADHGHAKEYIAKRWQKIEHVIDKTSEYNIHLFDEIANTKSYQEHIDIWEYRYESYSYCTWSHGAQECVGPIIDAEASKRFIEDRLKQKEVDSVYAVWESPNVMHVVQKIERVFTSAMALQGPKWPERCWGGEDQSDFLNMAAWPCLSRKQWFIDLMTIAKFFYGYPMPGDEWSEIQNDWTFPTFDGWMWKRTTEVDDFVVTPINEYRIDNKIVLDASKWDRTYYLDDRSTDESHGIIVAAKDYIKATESTPEIVHGWKIYWAKEETNYIDITADVLTVLGIEKEQLYEIGLI